MANDVALDEKLVTGLQQAARDAGQGHLFADWDLLSGDERKQLVKDSQDVDFKYVESIFRASMAGATSTPDAQPCHDVLALQDGSPEQRQAWTQHGWELIAQGKAAALLLAGGQGTRLGSSLPKGCYNVGLPSNKSLFQIHAERLLKVQQLAAQRQGSHAAPSTSSSSPQPTPAHGASASAPAPSPPCALLHWYIMTSPFTHEDTVAHFEAHGFFGLDRAQVHFFQQGFLPCLTEQGGCIMSTRCSLAKAPDGNGGVYMALHRSGCLAEMQRLGIECVDAYSVDNLLARVADPLFLGYCHDRRAEVGSRVVAKAYPEEKVGVFARRGDALAVLEYSELDPAVACAPDPTTGRLLYNWSNICMHYFSTDWLCRVSAHLQVGAAYHVARKSIPSKDGPVQGIKLELFIFDTFPLAAPGRVALMEVDRQAEFAPVKNAPGSAADSPDTARAALLSLHKTWVQAAGGHVPSAEGVEVAPSVSYSGEGLDDICRGRSFETAWSDVLQGKSGGSS